MKNKLNWKIAGIVFLVAAIIAIWMAIDRMHPYLDNEEPEADYNTVTTLVDSTKTMKK